MNILVTGGCGFIGSHVVDALLARGDRVTVLDDLSSGQRANLDPRAELIVGDVADAAAVAAATADADAIVHFAAIASVQVCEQDPARAARVNITGTAHVFAAAAKRGIPVVYASSAAVYGDNPNLPLQESESPQPLGRYGAHKRENEQTAAEHAAHVASVGLRFFNVYGPRQDPRSPYSGVISKFVGAAQQAEPLTVFGDGLQTRDFIFVGDVVRLVISCLEHARGLAAPGALVLNGCSGQATSLLALIAAIAPHFPHPLIIEHQPARLGDIRHSCGHASTASSVLAFRADTPLTEGLKHLILYEANARA
jgi:UDP-glucose 4-epimerase